MPSERQALGHEPLGRRWPHISFDSAAGTALCSACGGTRAHGLRLEARVVNGREMFDEQEAEQFADFVLAFAAKHGPCVGGEIREVRA